MKIIYNIINHCNTGGGIIEFKLRLAKTEWVLINQFPNKKLSARHTFEDDYLASTSNNVEKGKRGFGEINLVFNFNLDFKEVQQEGADSFWESETFTLRATLTEEPLKTIIDSIAEQLKNQIIAIEILVPGEDDSCWAEELVIDY